MPDFTAYHAAYAWLFDTLVTDPQGGRFLAPKTAAEQKAHFQAQIGRTADFLAYVGHPERVVPAVHVAGTSGKGSVTVMMAHLLRAAGWQVGHHTSPYLQLPLEKLVANGRLLPPSDFVALVETFRAHYTAWLAQGGDSLRYGEAWAAMVFLWLARSPLDWAVVETSLGGRFDPTNALPAKLAIITNVDWDHEQVLGPTLADIAWHKAGIIKPNQPVVTAVTHPEALAVVRREAAARHAPLYAMGEQWHTTFSAEGLLTVHAPFHTYADLAMGRGYQAHNAAVAVVALDVLGQAQGWPPLTAAQVEQALAAVRFAGRLEQVQDAPPVMLDGAHNPHKMAALIATISPTYAGRPITAVVGAIRGKNSAAMLAALKPIVTRFILTQPHVPGKPAFTPQELVALLGETGAAVETAANTAEAIALALAQPTDLVLITGSLYLVGEARAYWYPTLNLLAQAEAGVHEPLY